MSKIYKNYKTHNIIILLLIALDQTIKIIVKNYAGVRVAIINNIIYFMPTQNTNYSWINSLFQLGWGRIFHIALTIVILIFSSYGFKYLDYKNAKNKFINTIKIFLFSGIICSLIDRVYWNGSWDYILLKGFFVFDLKDCYINVFIFGFIILYIKNIKVLSKIKDRDLLKDYIKFIKEDLSIIEVKIKKGE